MVVQSEIKPEQLKEYIKEYDFLRDTVNNILLEEVKEFWTAMFPPYFIYKVLVDMGMDKEGETTIVGEDIVFFMKHWAMGKIYVSVAHATGFKGGFYIRRATEEEE